MKIPAKVFLPAAICFFSLFTLYLFHTVPESRLWKGWTVFYVESSVLSEADILATLTDNGCKNVISRSNQRSPIVSPYSPLQLVSADSYLNRRNAFFFDETSQAMVFYVPDSEGAALSRAIEAIEHNPNTECGTDSAAAFPYLAPLFTLVFAIITLVLSKRKLYFAPCALFFVALAFSRPLFTVATCSSFALAGFFILLKLIGRQGFLRRTMRSPIAVLLLIMPLFVLCASSPVNTVFYVLALSGAISALLLIEALRELYYKNAFSPIYIRTAYDIAFINAVDVKALAALTGACILVLLASLWGRTVQASSGSSDKLALPAPVSYGNADVLPNLDDFLVWSWKTVTFPYQRLSQAATTEAPKEGERITLPTYSEEGGAITAREETVLVFDGGFRDNILSTIKTLDYPALEAMLVKQGRTAIYAFVRNGNEAVERLGALLLTMCTTISLGVTAYCTLRKRRYGFGK